MWCPFTTVSKNIYNTHTHTPIHLGVKFAKNNIFLRPEEAMFIELVKACLTEEKYSVLEKM